MIRPAQLYKTELEQAQYETWYDMKYKFWNADCWNEETKLDENNWDRHQFVSVSKEGNRVLGYISYNVHHQSLKAASFAIISFGEKTAEFGLDVYQAIYDIFFKYNLNKIEFYAYTENPVIKTYRRFIKKVGGKSCGVKRQTVMLLDHKLYDEEEFEILKEEFIPLKHFAKNKSDNKEIE